MSAGWVSTGRGGGFDREKKGGNGGKRKPSGTDTKRCESNPKNRFVWRRGFGGGEKKEERSNVGEGRNPGKGRTAKFNATENQGASCEIREKIASTWEKPHGKPLVGKKQGKEGVAPEKRKTKSLGNRKQGNDRTIKKDIA